MKKKVVTLLLSALLIANSVPVSGTELPGADESSTEQTGEVLDGETSENSSEGTEAFSTEDVDMPAQEEEIVPIADTETEGAESTENQPAEGQEGQQDNLLLSEQEELERNANNSATVTDTVTLNAALESAKSMASASSPYEIKLSAGTYAVSKALTVPSYVTLDLGNADIQYSASDNYAIYLKPGTTNVSITGGKIHGGGIYANEAAVLDISNVNIDGYKENGIYINNSKVNSIKGAVCSGGIGGIYLKETPADEISGCTVLSAGDYGIQTKGNASVLKGIKNNSITGASAKDSDNGIYVTDGASVAELSGNKVSKFSTGMYIRGAAAGSVAGNEVRETGLYGIYLAQSSVVNGDIKENLVDKFGTNGVKIVKYSVEGSEPAGIQLYTGCKVSGKISNNKISNGKGKGILITGPTETKAGSSAGDIEYNTITQCTGDGIAIYHGSHCGAIVNNILDTIGGNHSGKDGDYGIIIDSMMAADTYCTKIENNSIKNVTYAGIAVYSGPAESTSTKFQDTGHVKENISNNTLVNCGSYPASKDWKTEISKGGKQGCLSGIYVDTHGRVYGDICNNTISKTGEHGVYIHLCSFVENIYNNNIDGCKQAGVEVYKSTVTGDIYNNIITNSGTNGIAGGNDSVVKGSVRDNTITGTGGCGIYLDKSKFPVIVNNTMTGVKKNGIYVSDKSSSQNIALNQISMNKEKDGYGIKVADGSKVKDIKQNTIQGKMVYGIRISCAYNNISITSNTITTSNASKKAFSPIHLTGDKKYTFTVKKNMVTGNKTNYGIRVLKGKASISGNTVKKTTYPVYIEKNNMNVTVKDNVLSGNNKNLVKVVNSKYAVSPVKMTSAKSIKGKKAALAWKGIKGFKNYEIYQSASENGSFKKIAGSKNTKYTVSKLKKSKTYYFKVCGVAKNGKVTVYTEKSKSKKVKITK